MVDTLMRGGFMMVPILLGSVLALTIIIDRLWTLQRSKVSPQPFLERMNGMLRQGKCSEALGAASSAKSGSDPLKVLSDEIAKEFGEFRLSMEASMPWVDTPVGENGMISDEAESRQDGGSCASGLNAVGPTLTAPPVEGAVSARVGGKPPASTRTSRATSRERSPKRG